MGIERIWKLARALGHREDLELRVRRGPVGSINAQWVVSLIRFAQASGPSLEERSSASPEGALTDLEEKLALDLKRRADEREDDARRLRAALKEGEGKP